MATETVLEEMRKEIDGLRRKVLRLERTISGDEGKLAPWVEERIKEALAAPRKDFIPLEKVKARF